MYQTPTIIATLDSGAVLADALGHHHHCSSVTWDCDR